VQEEEFLYIYKALKSTFEENSTAFDKTWSLLEDNCLSAMNGADGQSGVTDQPLGLIQCSTEIKDIFAGLEDRERELELISVEDLLLAGKLKVVSTARQNEINDKSKYLLSFLRVRCKNRIQHWQVLEDQKSQLQSRLELLNVPPTSTRSNSREIDCIRSIIQDVADQLSSIDLSWEAEPENQESKDKEQDRLESLRDLALKWWRDENQDEGSAELKALLVEYPSVEKIRDNSCLHCLHCNKHSTEILAH